MTPIYFLTGKLGIHLDAVKGVYTVRGRERQVKMVTDCINKHAAEHMVLHKELLHRSSYLFTVRGSKSRKIKLNLHFQLSNLKFRQQKYQFNLYRPSLLLEA